MSAPRSVAGGAAMAVGLVMACGGPVPSRAPLSSAAVGGAGPRRASSSRVVEGQGQPRRPEAEMGAPSSSDDDGDATRGAACPPSDGPAPDCSLLPSDNSCLGASLTRRACEAVGPALDPRVGAAWVECLQGRRAGADPCDAHRIVSCGLEAVASACVEGAFRGQCEAIARGCADVLPEITVPVCEKLLGAWKPDQRSRMVDCLTQGCETGGFGVCLP